jgi:hypothetical protein
MSESTHSIFFRKTADFRHLLVIKSDLISARKAAFILSYRTQHASHV